MSQHELLKSLWSCHSIEAVQKVMKSVNYKTASIGGRRNNSQVCTLASNSYVALTEGTTNALDANTVYYSNNNMFNVQPKNVHDAQRQIGRRLDKKGNSVQDPQVLVTLSTKQSGNSKNKNTVSIIDCGAGMSADSMINGILNIGSESKTTDPIQHGQFGGGGTTLFAHSDVNLIISRTTGKFQSHNHYRFTIAWLEEGYDDNGNLMTPSYVYATDMNGELFTADAAFLNYKNPFAPKIHEYHMNDGMILPEHGTVRRMIGMNINYNPGLWTFFSDQMFGSEAKIKTISDYDVSHAHTPKGRRRSLNEMEIVQDFPDKIPSEKQLLAHIPLSKLTVTDHGKKYSVQIEAWVISDWINAPDEWEANKVYKNNSKVTYNNIQYKSCKIQSSPIFNIKDWTILDTKKEPKIIRPVIGGDFLGNVVGQSASTALGLFVTQNGQTHDRRRTAIICRNSNLGSLVNNLIIEIRLDNIALHDRRLVFTGDRSRLMDTFAKALDEEIVNFLKGNSYLVKINEKMTKLNTVPFQQSSVSQIKQYLERNHTFLKQFLGMAGSENKQQGQLDNIASKMKNPPPIPPIPPAPLVLSTNPNHIVITSRRFIQGKTGYVRMTTDADNSYDATDIDITLPSFLNIADPSGKDRGLLTDGYFQIQVVCTGVVDEIGAISAKIRRHNGSILQSADQQVIVVEATKAKKNNVKTGNSDSSMDSMPDIIYKPVQGSDPAQFPGNDGEHECAFNYNFDRTNNKLEIVYNEELDLFKKIHLDLTKKHIGMANWFIGTYQWWMATSTLSLISRSNESDAGVTDEPLHRFISEMANGFLIVMQSTFLNDVDFMRTIKNKCDNSDEMDQAA